MAFPLIKTIQTYIAITSVGASTVRGYPKKTAERSQKFLELLDLHRLSVNDESDFQEQLDSLTDDLSRKIPGRKDENFAMARKLVNIFLHNAFYNVYLRDKFNLQKSEEFYEVPIDSLVSKGLIALFPKAGFKRWTTLKKLGVEEHDKYQDFASTYARKRGTQRVHLDALLWVKGREVRKQKEAAARTRKAKQKS